MPAELFGGDAPVPAFVQVAELLLEVAGGNFPGAFRILADAFVAEHDQVRVGQRPAGADPAHGLGHGGEDDEREQHAAAEPENSLHGAVRIRPVG